MDARSKRFEKEKHLIPTVQINEKYENMRINSKLLLTIPSNYPFQPPILKFQNKHYIYYLERAFQLFKPFIDEYKINTGYECCLCCSSITGDNWTPTYGIKEVLDEYNQYRTTLQSISNTKLVLDNLHMDNLINSTILSFIILLY